MATRIIIPMLAAVLVATVGCNTNNENDSNQEGLSENDSHFMTNATYANLGEVASGNLAASKAQDPLITNFATMMINDHGIAHNELMNIARDKGFSLPTETDEEHKNMENTLRELSGRTFDSTYIHMMVKGHEKAISLFEDETKDGKDPAVVSYAKDKLPDLRHHHQAADSIANALFPR